MRITLGPHDPEWSHRFSAFAADLRERFGARVPGRVAAIHHIGSTSVAGLAAKDVIDIQLTLRTTPDGDPFEPFEPVREAAEELGYRWQSANEDLRKRFFHLSDASGRRLVNLHIRPEGDFAAQAALLFRDLLRSSPKSRKIYESTKRSLAEHEWLSVDDYAMAKGDVIWSLLREGDLWAARTGWRPDPSDA